MGNREKKCQQGIHEWVDAKYLSTLNYGLVKIEEPKCRVCGKERKLKQTKKD